MSLSHDRFREGLGVQVGGVMDIDQGPGGGKGMGVGLGTAKGCRNTIELGLVAIPEAGISVPCGDRVLAVHLPRPHDAPGPRCRSGGGRASSAPGEVP